MSQSAEVSSPRLVVDNATVRRDLGLLSELAGTWTGQGFNLIARPDHKDRANLYLQLNQTHETLTMTSIGSAIPNRGFGQDDIELFGLSYLQQIHDQATGGALHLEPGLWITQPGTDYPPEQPPAGSPDAQIIARMASIPHGNAVLAQGNATRFTGPPALVSATQPYAGSVFPSFNSTPFGAGPPIVINAAGSSEKLTAAQIPGAVAFGEYDLTIPESAANPRTPFAATPAEPPLPAQINGELMQDIINDPIRLLQAVISKQVDSGHTFEGAVLNIATQNAVDFRQNPDSPPTGPTVNIPVTDAAGGIENILFLDGQTVTLPTGPPGGAAAPNAQTSLVYATFWIEKVTPTNGHKFMQLQYAQMTVLNFPIFSLLNPPPGGPAPLVVNLGWPHISVATLRKAFN
jgi:hypothetical protein